MRKLTAGIFTVVLGVVTSGAANAKIASTEYVGTKVQTLQDGITQNTNAIQQNTNAIAGKAALLTAEQIGENAGNLATVDANGQYQASEIKKSDLVTNDTVTQKIADALKDNKDVTDAVKKVLETDGIVTDAVDSVVDGKLSDMTLGAQGGNGVIKTVTQENGVVSAERELVTKSDLAQGVQDSLDKADTALQATDDNLGSVIKDALGTDAAAVLDSKVTADDVAQIQTNTQDIETINTNLGLLANTQIPNECGELADGCTLVYRSIDGGAPGFIWEPVARDEND